MKILALEKEIEMIREEQFLPFLKEEAQRVWTLQQEGIIREIYFTRNTRQAVLILECGDESAAKKILETLPLVREKLITFDIKALLAYDGFERLFENKL